MICSIALVLILLLAIDLSSGRDVTLPLHQIRRRDHSGASSTKCSNSKKTEYICHYDKALDTFGTICVHSSDVSKHLNVHTKDSRGRCEDKCNVSVFCMNSDLCKTASTLCDVTTDFVKKCVLTPITCTTGKSCDSSTGFCKADDQLVPAVAVIHEDSDFKHADGRKQAKLWSDFRKAYPVRPFCLLVPGKDGKVHVPQDFLDDDLTSVYYDVTSDYGDTKLAEDWASLCGLDLYTSAHVPIVALLVDDSDHVKHGKHMVDAAKALFYSDMKAFGMTVKTVTVSHENWILPFLTSFA